MHGMEYPPLHLRDGMTGILLEPAPVQMLGNGAELNQEVTRQIPGLDLASLLLPEP